MNIQLEQDKGAKIIAIEGRIDTNTAAEFEKTLLEELATAACLKIDLKKVDYVSSAGLRIFLNGQKYANKNGVKMTLLHITDSVMEILEMTGFSNILTIE